MEKTYQYVGQFTPCVLTGGIVLDPTYTTEDEAEQKFIEESVKFKKKKIALLLTIEKDYPEPKLDVSFKHSRSDLFENENIVAVKVPRLRAAAEVIGVEGVKSMKRRDLVNAIMARTTK